MNPVPGCRLLPEGKVLLPGAVAAARRRLPDSSMPAPPEGGACSVDSVHQWVSQVPCSTRKQPDAATNPEGSVAGRAGSLGCPKAPALAGPSRPRRPKATVSRIVGLPLGCPKASKKRRLLALRRVPTVDYRQGGVPKDSALPRRLGLPEGSPSMIGLCVVAPGLPKGAGCLVSLPLTFGSRRIRMSVACVLHPKVRSAGVSLRLLRRADSPPCVPPPEGGLVQGGWGHGSPLRRVRCCFPCDRSGLPKKIRRSGQTRRRFNGGDECPSRGRGGESSPKAVPIHSVCGETRPAYRVARSVPLSLLPEGRSDCVSNPTGNGLSKPPDPANTQAEAWDLPPAEAEAGCPKAAGGSLRWQATGARFVTPAPRCWLYPSASVLAEAGCLLR